MQCFTVCGGPLLPAGTNQLHDTCTAWQLKRLCGCRLWRTTPPCAWIWRLSTSCRACSHSRTAPSSSTACSACWTSLQVELGELPSGALALLPAQFCCTRVSLTFYLVCRAPGRLDRLLQAMHGSLSAEPALELPLAVATMLLTLAQDGKGCRLFEQPQAAACAAALLQVCLLQHTCASMHLILTT